MTEKQTWRRITRTENVPAREGRCTRIDNREIAIFNLGDRFVAIDNECPHRGGPLSDGIVSGTTIVCPLHGWRFDLETGLAVRASLPSCVTTYPTRIEDGIILIDVDGGSRIEPEEAAA